VGGPAALADAAFILESASAGVGEGHRGVRVEPLDVALPGRAIGSPETPPEVGAAVGPALHVGAPAAGDVRAVLGRGIGTPHVGGVPAGYGTAAAPCPTVGAIAEAPADSCAA